VTDSLLTAFRPKCSLSEIRSKDTHGRATFLRSLAALAAAGVLPLTARANANLKMMIPANPAAAGKPPAAALRQASRRPASHRSVS